MRQQWKGAFALSAGIAFLLAACGGGSSGTSGPGAIVHFANGQAAIGVIGQADFTSGSANRGGAPAANTLSGPWGSPAIYNGTLYVPDFSNNRILGFNTAPPADGAAADFVWGQPDFATAAGGTSSGTAADRFSGPQGIGFAAGKMLLDDFSNSRVLIWNSLPAATSGYITADVVVGQKDGVSNAATCDDATTASPEAFFVIGTKLLVADSGHHRVLIWDQLPTSSGTPANHVLGQGDFTSCSANRGAVTTDANTLNYPSGIWSDGTRLFIADGNNNRILIWDAVPTSDGQPADHVLGQADMTTAASGAGAAQLKFPYFMTSNGTQLFVSDADNIRVLVWDALPTANATPADHVLGQSGFGSAAAQTSSSGLKAATGLLIDGNDLYVGDGDNSRFLIFQGS